MMLYDQLARYDYMLEPPDGPGHDLCTCGGWDCCDPGCEVCDGAPWPAEHVTAAAAEGAGGECYPCDHQPTGCQRGAADDPRY